MLQVHNEKFAYQYYLMCTCKSRLRREYIINRVINKTKLYAFLTNV